ncbi:MAG: peptidase M10 [Chitinophagaceae bacterium]|nr:MAG: peptidase M10 [Chitinophagaceae bacterium]
MGEVELLPDNGELLIRSVLVFYGDASTPLLASTLAADVSRYWNEPAANVTIGSKKYIVRFLITGVSEPGLDPEQVWYNDDPSLNFFRIEKYAAGNISFVDGLGSNTGYFKLDNLLQTGSTIAHEYGHTLGLPHPELLDVRGQGTPGIMYPRGTLCDAPMQYDPLAAAGAYGGVMDPSHRKVLASDIAALRLNKLSFDNSGKAVLGEFTSLYHQKHIDPEQQKQ